MEKNEELLQKLRDFRMEKMIELKNENATDQGGPYHEVFSNFCQELESESLDLFIKTTII